MIVDYVQANHIVNYQTNTKVLCLCDGMTYWKNGLEVWSTPTDSCPFIRSYGRVLKFHCDCGKCKFEVIYDH